MKDTFVIAQLVAKGDFKAATIEAEGISERDLCDFLAQGEVAVIMQCRRDIKNADDRLNKLAALCRKEEKLRQESIQWQLCIEDTEDLLGTDDISDEPEAYALGYIEDHRATLIDFIMSLNPTQDELNTYMFNPIDIEAYKAAN